MGPPLALPLMMVIFRLHTWTMTDSNTATLSCNLSQLNSLSLSMIVTVALSGVPIVTGGLVGPITSTKKKCSQSFASSSTMVMLVHAMEPFITPSLEMVTENVGESGGM